MKFITNTSDLSKYLAIPIKENQLLNLFQQIQDPLKKIQCLLLSGAHILMVMILLMKH